MILQKKLKIVGTDFKQFEIPNGLPEIPSNLSIPNDPFVNQQQSLAIHNPNFLPLDTNNSLKPNPTSFLRSYSCVQRQWKGWVTVIILVIVADYTFIMGGYTLVLLVAGWLQKHKDGNSGKISLKLN